MPVAAPARQPDTALHLTYEALLAEPSCAQRYDIVDGERIVSSPSTTHQIILGNIYVVFRAFQRQRGGVALMAPRDVLIQRYPLRTRQPDVLFISSERCSMAPGDAAPFPVGPELAVEILSPSETRQGRADKIRDYQSVGVLECWVVSPSAQTVEVLRLSPDAVESVAVYDVSQTVSSVVFPDLAMPVADIFAE